MTEFTRKKRLVFEASILSCFDEKTFGRSGIYFVAEELLKQFVQTPDFEISLYGNEEFIPGLKRFAETFYPELTVLTRMQTPATAFIQRQLSAAETKQASSFFQKCRKGLGKRLFRALLKSDHLFTWIFDYARFNSFDVYFSPFRKAPSFIQANRKIKRYLMIHDFISAQFPSYRHMKKDWMRIAWDGINKKDTYICISEHTKKDLLSLFPFVNEKQIFVNYNGISRRFFEELSPEKSREILSKYQLKAKSYMFSIGSLVPHKNLKMQIQAFARFLEQSGISDFYYVIAGPAEKLQTFLEESGVAESLKKNYKCIGYIEDHEVPFLYHNALWCSFTSLYEGFGIPAIEAMSSSCPLVCSNTTSLIEIGKGAALLVNPESEAEHVSAYSRLYSDEALRSELIEKGLARARNFTWEKSAENLIRFIHDSAARP